MTSQTVEHIAADQLTVTGGRSTATERARSGRRSAAAEPAVNGGRSTADAGASGATTRRAGPQGGLEDDVGAWSEEELEDGLTTLAGQIAAATCRFLLLLAEYDRRRGWARWDCGSAAQWLSWRCQIGPRAAREHLRVAHRLAELPAITEEFRLGRLSYSKVRAITRVATPDNEADLLMLARHGTAAQLERAVSAYRRVGRLDDDTAAADQLRGRRLDWHYEGDGSMVIRVRLPAERGELALTALRALLEEIAVEDEVDPDDAERCEDGTDDAAATARTNSQASVSSAPADEAPHGRHSEDGSEDPCAEVTSGARSAGGSAEPADEVADDPRAAAYADAFVAVAEHALACRGKRRSNGDRYQVVVHIDAETLEDPAADGDSSLDNGRALAPSTVRRMACDAALVPVLSDALGEPLDIGRKRRAIPAGMRRAVLARDRRCRYPTCDRSIDEVHHIRHWIDGGETRIGNLIGLCWFHHARHHQDAFAIRLDGSGTVVFERPDGAQLTDWRPPGGSLDELLADLAQRGIEIAPQTAVSDWYGEALDLDLATWILCTRGAPHADGYAAGHNPHEPRTDIGGDTTPTAG